MTLRQLHARLGVILADRHGERDADLPVLLEIENGTPPAIEIKGRGSHRGRKFYGIKFACSGRMTFNEAHMDASIMTADAGR